MDLTNKDLNEIKLWIEALRSGKFNQSIDTLQDLNGYCCLGVACKVVIPQEDLITDNEILIGQFPKSQQAPVWLRLINDNFYEKVGKELTSLNDNYNFTFLQIAELIEDLYIKKLDKITVENKVREILSELYF